MKKIIIVFAGLAFSFTALAQKSSWYIRSGLNMADVSVPGRTPESYYDKEAKSLVSFHAGFMANLFVGKRLAVQPSLLFTGKGARLTSRVDGYREVDYYEATTRPYYIELPVNLVYHVPLKPGKRAIYFGGGAYGARGMTGNNIARGADYSGNSYQFREKIKFDKGPEYNALLGGMGHIYRWDYGLNAVAGLDLKKFVFSLNYGHGLQPVNYLRHFYSGVDKNKHRVFSLSAGVRL